MSAAAFLGFLGVSRMSRVATRLRSSVACLPELALHGVRGMVADGLQSNALSSSRDEAQVNRGEGFPMPPSRETLQLRPGQSCVRAHLYIASYTHAELYDFRCQKREPS